MIIRKITLTIILSILSISAFSETGFDEICKIYTEAKNSSLTKSQLSDYVFDNVKNRVNSKDALDAHSAVFSLGLDIYLKSLLNIR